MTLRRRTLLSLCYSVCMLAACNDTPSSPITEDAGVDAATNDDAFVPVDMPQTLDSSIAPDMATSDAATPADAGEDFAQSYLKRSCGPADGPAFELALFNSAVPACTVDPALEALTFYVHDLSGATIPPTAGTTITSTEASSSGTANRCPGGSDECEFTENWTLTFSSYTDGGGAVGTYSATWSDGSVSAGQFNATWCAGTPLCG